MSTIISAFALCAAGPYVDRLRRCHWATNGGCRVTQTARYRPRGLFGRVYWYAVLPFHSLVFPGMLRGVLHDAESLAAEDRAHWDPR